MIRGAIRRVHFVGIGGTGMCGLAEILLSLRYNVTGSDLVATSEAAQRLISIGARVFEGHASENTTGADLLVVSTAIRDDNPEVRAAQRAGIPILRRGQMLAEIMRLKYGVAVAGSHGKTTTTSLIGHVLSRAGMDPTLVVGGRLRSIDSHARVGKGDVFVAEADESDGSFLEILPTVAVVTNIDREHLEHYRNMDAIKAAFEHFVSSVPFYGTAILCADDPRVREILPQINRPTILYGFAPDSKVRAEKRRSEGQCSRFQLWVGDVALGEFRVPLPGEHNVQNALAAIAVSVFLGVDPEKIRDALEGFEGVGRRFEVRKQVGGVLHVDDYGHHPTEIRAVLKAAREVYGLRRLVVLFQPHRYTRTVALHNEFAGSFTDADLLILTDIYAAGEMPMAGVTGGVLQGPITSASQIEVVYAPTKEQAVQAVCERLEPEDVLLTLGAGPVWQWGDAAMERLQERHRRPQGCSV
ncbi:MAG: UDP-N-acetylmuramate--L-alanine ligase [Candidatus Eisenbacteria sp.]|nr:UDP-N-acetylmuramate--L-alanine ligase [Candidatus Eisenbacteria bacterium]